MVQWSCHPFFLQHLPWTSWTYNTVTIERCWAREGRSCREVIYELLLNSVFCSSNVVTIPALGPLCLENCSLMIILDITSCKDSHSDFLQENNTLAVPYLRICLFFFHLTQPQKNWFRFWLLINIFDFFPLNFYPSISTSDCLSRIPNNVSHTDP